MVEQKGGLDKKTIRQLRKQKDRIAENLKKDMVPYEAPSDEELEKRSKEIDDENAEEEKRQKGLIFNSPKQRPYRYGGKPRSKSRKTKRKNKKTRKTRRRRSKK